MISWRTKALLSVASLPPLACIGVVVWLALLPYLTLLPYYDRLMSNNSRFVIFHFHFTPLSWIWVITLVAGLTSLLYDRRAVRKP
jgi:hypothetical protein